MGLSIKISTKSGRPLRSTLKKFAKAVERAGEQEIFREATEIFAAVEKVGRVPLKTGALRGSGRIEGPFKRGKETVIFVAYGNSFGVDYALVRHEVEARRYTTPGTGIKYLTEPFKGFKPGMAKRVQSGIRKRVRSRGINVI